MSGRRQFRERPRIVDYWFSQHMTLTRRHIRVLLVRYAGHVINVRKKMCMNSGVYRMGSMVGVTDTNERFTPQQALSTKTASSEYV